MRLSVKILQKKQLMNTQEITKNLPTTQLRFISMLSIREAEENMARTELHNKKQLQQFSEQRGGWRQSFRATRRNMQPKETIWRRVSVFTKRYGVCYDVRYCAVLTSNGFYREDSPTPGPATQPYTSAWPTKRSRAPEDHQPARHVIIVKPYCKNSFFLFSISQHVYYVQSFNFLKCIIHIWNVFFFWLSFFICTHPMQLYLQYEVSAICYHFWRMVWQTT